MAHRSSRTLAAGVVLAAAGLLLVACADAGDEVSTGSDATGGQGGTDVADLEDVTWVLDGDASDLTVPEGAAATAQFRAGQVGGSSGCNRYSAPYTVEGDEMSIGPAVGTRRMCETPLMDLEGEYLGRLDRVASWAIADEMLTLSDDEGEPLLVFGTFGPEVLVGDWTVNAFLSSPTAFSTLVPGTEITATFADDGTLSGSGGCNTYSGSYEAEGTDLSIGPVAATELACVDPEGVMEQESAYFAVLERVARYEIEGSSLLLLAADDQRLVELFSAAGT